MRSGRTAGGFLEVVDGLHVSRVRRISVHIENKHAAVLKAGQPELAPIIGESAVVCFVASTNGSGADDFAVIRRSGLYIHSHEFVRTIAQAFHAERPNIDELLLPLDASKVRRRAGFIRAHSAQAEAERQRERPCEHCV